MPRIPSIQRRWLNALHQHPLRTSTHTSHPHHNERGASLSTAFHSDSLSRLFSSHLVSIHSTTRPRPLKGICRIVQLPAALVKSLHTPATAAIPIAEEESYTHSGSSSSSSSRSSTRRRVLSRELLWSVFLVVQFTSFMYVVRHYVFDVMSCVGPSMLPTMNTSGDLVLISCHRRYHYQRGDVVVAQSITNPRHKVCKRIIGLPHDTITPPHSHKAITVPAGHVWLQGDNLNNSSDSRLYGPVPLAMVVGRVEAKLWPFTQIGWVERTMRYSGLEGRGSGGRRRYEVDDVEEAQEEGIVGLLSGTRGRLGAGALAESSRQTPEQTQPAAVDAMRAADSVPPTVQRPVESKPAPQVVLIPFTPAGKRTPPASPAPPATPQ